MTTITISDDTADKLFQDILVHDYQCMVKQVQNLKDMQSRGELKPHEQDDLDHSIKFRDAMAVMLTYYLTHDEYSKFLIDT